MTKNENIKDRRKAILDYLINFGPFGIPAGTKEELAQKWGCTVRTIELDIKLIIKSVKVPPMKELARKFIINYERAMKVVAQLMQDDDPVVRARGVREFNNTQAHYTEMCEKYGFKEVVADRLAVEADVNLKPGTISIIMPEGVDGLEDKPDEEAVDRVEKATG